MIDKVLPDSVEPEYINGSNTLVNLLGITNLAELNSKEADITFILSLELFADPNRITPYSFGFEHLKAIHKHLFGNIYEWAGKARSFDMAKSNSVFTPANKLTEFESIVFSPSTELFESLQTKKSLTDDTVTTQLSKSLGLINQFHPFPEGNGRTQRLFISSLAKALGYHVDWSNVQTWEMIEVCKRVHEGNYEPMQIMMSRILSAI